MVMTAKVDMKKVMLGLAAAAALVLAGCKQEAEPSR